jgi:phage terminase large subunit-like protein
METAAQTGTENAERDARRRQMLAFAFHREDPEATLASVEDQVEKAAEDGRPEEAGRLMRVGMTAVRFWQMKERLRGRHTPPPSAPPPDPDPAPEPVAPPVELRPAQRPPEALPNGDPWRTWLFLGGRGAGKTRAGAEWLADQAEALGPGGRLALIGPTLHDVREVMIEGVSGIRSLPRWTARTRPVFESSRRRLKFANGCIAYAFSAEDPDSLRGPQFSAAWADEFCAWPSTGARGAAETLALLRMGLRLPLPSPSAAPDSSSPAGGGGPPKAVEGEGVAQAASDRVASVSHPRLLVTTTPRPARALVRLRDEASCALTHAATTDNAAHLAPGFVEGLRELYGGTRREAQELDGRIIDVEGALFTAGMMMRARRPSPPGGDGKFERIVVAIDPPATATGDACGIVAAGSRLRADGVREAVILADRSAHGLSPEEWARRAVALAHEVKATRLVAEVNQGGDMVASVLKAVDRPLPLRTVRATRGKVLRAEPVAALYEQGRVRHAGMFDALEEELMMLGAELGEGSLDRADALVWAVTDLLIDRPGERGPRIRVL